MKKLFFLMAFSVMSHTLWGIWPFNKKNQPDTTSRPLPKDLISDINKLINQNQRLKKEVGSLAGEKAPGILREIDQRVDYQKIADTLKNIDTGENEKDSKIAELEKEVEYLGRSLVNALKTFEANINSKEFTDTLKRELTRLDSKESAKLVNEAMANALYRLKFMYIETRYLLNWTNGKINWKAAEAKGIKPPVLKNNLSENEIKNMVMAVKVD